MARTQRNIVTSQLCLQTPMKARLSANNNERTILAISQKDIHWLLRYDNAEPRQYKLHAQPCSALLPYSPSYLHHIVC